MLFLCFGSLPYQGQVWSYSPPEVVAFDAQKALEWLQFDSSKRQSACLIFRELASQVNTSKKYFRSTFKATTQFYSYVPSFLDLVWVALRDANTNIRQSAKEALSDVLTVTRQIFILFFKHSKENCGARS